MTYRFIQITLGLILCCALAVACSTDKSDEPGQKVPTPTDKVEENKEAKLYGTWQLDREDSGFPIMTVLTLNSDKTCSYSQVMDGDESDALKLSGKWSFDDKKSTLSIAIGVEEDEITLNAAVVSDLSSFSITDSYSESDNYSFKKK